MSDRGKDPNSDSRISLREFVQLQIDELRDEVHVLQEIVRSLNLWRAWLTGGVVVLAGAGTIVLTWLAVSRIFSE